MLHACSSPPQAVPNIQELRLRAERFNAEAELSLGCAYRDGAGVPKDRLQAYVWLDLATVERASQPPYIFKKAAIARDGLGLTSKEVAQAQLLEAQALPPVYELRSRTSADGKLDVLKALFRDRVIPLFKSHGIEGLGYWVAAKPNWYKYTPYEFNELNENTLIYILKHPNIRLALAHWDEVLRDPEWGKVTTECKAIESLWVSYNTDRLWLYPMDLSIPKTVPPATPTRKPIFQLDIYTVKGLHDHAIRPVRSGGMQSIGVWVYEGNPLEIFPSALPPVRRMNVPGIPDWQDRLIYLTKHPSEAMARSQWIKVRDTEAPLPSGATTGVRHGDRETLWLYPIGLSTTK